MLWHFRENRFLGFDAVNTGGRADLRLVEAKLLKRVEIKELSVGRPPVGRTNQRTHGNPSQAQTSP